MLLESQQFEAFQRWLVDAEEGCRRYPAYWMALGGWAIRQQQPRQAVRLFGEAILREPGENASIRPVIRSSKRAPILIMTSQSCIAMLAS